MKTMILFLALSLGALVTPVKASELNRAAEQFQQLSNHYYSVAYMFLFYGEMEAANYFFGKVDAYNEAITYLRWLDRSQVSAERPAIGENLNSEKS